MQRTHQPTILLKMDSAGEQSIYYHKHRHMKFFFLAFFLGISISGFSQAKSVDKIIALVNDQMILESDVRFYRKKYADSSNHDCKVIQKLIVDKLLYSKAVKDSIAINEEEVDAELDSRMEYFVNIFGSTDKFEKYYGKTLSELKADFREDVKQQMLADRAKYKLLTGMNPSPKDVKDYYNALPKDSIQYYNAEMQLAQIVFLPKISRDAKKAMKAKAEKIRRELINKESSFGTQAILHSDDSGSASNGGELGWVGPGEMVSEFEQAAFSLPIGQISDLVESQYGIHIIEAMERKNGKTRVRHILLTSKPDADGIEKALKLADSVRKLIQDNKLTFQKAVELYSDDKFFKSNGGILINMKSKTRSPLFQIGDIEPAIAPQINNMHVGDITTPTAYQTMDRKYGYRIVKIIAETPPHKASLETDYNRIKEIVHENMKDKALEKWLKFYKNYVFVKLYDEYKNCPNLSMFNTNM